MLCVDDDVFLLRALRRSLRSHGLDVETAETVAAARALIGERKPDVAIVDLRLSDGDGAELLPLLRERKVPALVLSGYFDASRAPELARWHALAIPKPAPPAVVAQVVRTLLDRHRLSHQLFAELHGLSEREALVVAYAAGGLDTEQTAARLACSPGAVKVFWKRVFDKLAVRDRATVVALYLGFRGP